MKSPSQQQQQQKSSQNPKKRKYLLSFNTLGLDCFAFDYIVKCVSLIRHAKNHTTKCHSTKFTENTMDPLF